MESLLHLQLTPHRGVTILWHHLRCVPAARISRSSQKDKAAALTCGVVIPMLNPFVYSLRNKDTKAALRKLVGKVAPLSPRAEKLFGTYHVPGPLFSAWDTGIHPISALKAFRVWHGLETCQ